MYNPDNEHIGQLIKWIYLFRFVMVLITITYFNSYTITGRLKCFKNCKV